MTKVYTYPPALRRVAMTATGAWGAFLVWTIIRGEMNLDAVLVFSLMGVLSMVSVVELNGTLQLDENGIRYRGWGRESVVKWSEITEVITSSHRLFITTAHRKIALRHGEYAGIGMGYEPFEDLCQEVTRHTLPRLSQSWAQRGLPLVCRYPGITRKIVLAYAIPTLLLVTSFILFVVQTEGMLVGKVAFLLAGVLVMVPFWLRDYSRNCRTLLVTTEGIMQTNGQDITIAWADIQEITLTEEAFGFDWIIVKGHGGTEIRIPRSLPECGAILYWLKRFTILTETSQPVMME